MTENEETILILGGGLAGVTAAHELSRRGASVILVEREEEVGGLAKSLTHTSENGEFTYDIGPHRFHSTDPRVHEATLSILGENVVERERLSRIFLYDKFFHYPLKLGSALTKLPKLVMLRALFDYAAQSVKNVFSRGGDENFESWVVRRFGRKLFNIFFGVYTEKTWGVPCTEISSDWAAQRISQTSLLNTVKTALFRPKGDVRSLISTFHYPAHGGIGEISRAFRTSAVSNGAQVHLKTEVQEILVEDGVCLGVRVRDENGEEREIRADRVLNTIPLTNLVRLSKSATDDTILDHVDKMRHRSMVFVYLVLDREQLTPDHWLYIPEASLTFHRLSEYKNFSDHCAPRGKTMICAEITCDHGDDVWTDTDENLRRITVDDLAKIGLVKPSEVLETFTHREVYAYPLYTLGYREHLDAVLQWIDGIQNLDSTGRQGLFKYNNMDHSIAMGLTAADALLEGNADHRAVASGKEYFG